MSGLIKESFEIGDIVYAHNLNYSITSSHSLFIGIVMQVDDTSTDVCLYTLYSNHYSSFARLYDDSKYNANMKKSFDEALDIIKEVRRHPERNLSNLRIHNYVTSLNNLAVDDTCYDVDSMHFRKINKLNMHSPAFVYSVMHSIVSKSPKNFQPHYMHAGDKDAVYNHFCLTLSRIFSLIEEKTPLSNIVSPITWK